MSKLYLDNGFLNIPYIDKVATSNYCPFRFIIGKRQVGKTYGTLQYMINEERQHILMRRTKPEMEFLVPEENNPYRKFEQSISFVNSTPYTMRIIKTIDDVDGGVIDRIVGMVCSLSTVAKIRGFDGSVYSDLVYDEFIPESHIVRIRNEGDAFLNAYVSISGNRELEGKEPLRAWLLANTNNINSPILESFGIIDVVADMVRTKKEECILRDRGIYILIPQSEVISTKRSQTALYKAVGVKSQFAAMSLGAEFAYNDMSGVGNVDIKQYKPIFIIKTYSGDVLAYVHKNGGSIYFTDIVSVNTRNIYDRTDAARRRLLLQYPNIKAYILRGNARYSSANVKKNVFDFLC
jgi:hypothetical protein